MLVFVIVLVLVYGNGYLVLCAWCAVPWVLGSGSVAVGSASGIAS